MGINWPPQNVVVVGFCGSPTNKATALRAPFFRESSGFYFANSPDSPDQPTLVHKEDDLAGLESSAQITIIRSCGGWPRIKGGVVLYAHKDFLYPKNLLHLSLPGNNWIEEGEFHCRYVSRSEGLEVLEGWGKSLIKDADSHLRNKRQSDLERALSSAQRARICAPLNDLRGLRFEVFVHLLTIWQALGRDTKRIIRDISLDFDDSWKSQILDSVKMKSAIVASLPSPADEACQILLKTNPQPAKTSVPDPADLGKIKLRRLVAGVSLCKRYHFTVSKAA